MPKQNSGSSPSQTDDASNDMVDQVVARVLAAMQDQKGDTGQAQHKVEEAAQQARQKASGVVEMAQQQAASRIDRQKEQAVDELTSVADTLRQMGDQLKQPEHGAVAQYAAQYGDIAADQIESLSTYLRAHDAPQLVREVESFARREPVLFLSSAFLLGLVGARFLKSKPVSGGAIAAPAGAAAPLALPMPALNPTSESSQPNEVSANAMATDAMTDDALTDNALNTSTAATAAPTEAAASAL